MQDRRAVPQQQQHSKEDQHGAGQGQDWAKPVECPLIVVGSKDRGSHWSPCKGRLLTLRLVTSAAGGSTPLSACHAFQCLHRTALLYVQAVLCLHAAQCMRKLQCSGVLHYGLQASYAVIELARLTQSVNTTHVMQQVMYASGFDEEASNYWQHILGSLRSHAVHCCCSPNAS